MQAIRPTNRTDEEILRQVYLMGNEMLPKEWVEELCKRLANAIDNHPDADDIEDEAYERGFEEGFAAGVAHAEDEELK
jgi:hypothetical protein